MVKRYIWLFIGLLTVSACAGGAEEPYSPPAEDTPSCMPGALRCWERVSQRCDDEGVWQNQEVCPFLCNDGVCIGSCVSGALACDGMQVRRCVDGEWEIEGETCPFGCEAGACVGACEENTSRCWEGVLQRCEEGTWRNSETCPFVCAIDRCEGECVPGERRCDGLDVQICQDGFWQTSETCAFACATGSCAGTCEEGAQRCSPDGVQVCDHLGTWQTTELCPFLCQEGACAGVCEPGSARCEGDRLLTCDVSASWSLTRICPAGCAGGACVAECLPDELRCFGDVLQRCDALGHWANDRTCSLGCDAEACITECTPGEEQCFGDMLRRCGDDGFWEDEEACRFGCAAAVCLACEPGQTRCLGTFVQTCSEQGNWGPVSSCAAGMQCVAEDCAEIVTPSCAGGGPGLSDCGPSGTEDCCESLLVPGGTFNQDNDPNLPATLSDFRLDRYEVTVGRFRRFVEATRAGWSPQAGDGRHHHLDGGAGLVERGATFHEPGWSASWVLPQDWDAAFGAAYGCNWTVQPGPNENLAMNCIHWEEAYAFCIWDGGFLPSEAEWNYAAAGGDQQRFYPWGAADPSSGAYAFTGASCGSFCNAPGIVGVHPDGAGRWGHEDMAGNAAEWVLDWYRPYTGSVCHDCVSLDGTASFHGMRGGAHWDPPGPLISTEYRYYGTPSFRVIGAGVRCARAP